MQQQLRWMRLRAARSVLLAVCLASTNTVGTACGAQNRINAADRAWERLQGENGDTYSWVHESESIFDESILETSLFVRNGVLVQRILTRYPGLSGGEFRTEEQGSAEDLESGLSTIPAWHEECRRISGLRSPLERMIVELDDDGLISKCNLGGESSVENEMVGVTFGRW